jgi:membrane protein YqaA with SNARE-associated domain
VAPGPGPALRDHLARADIPALHGYPDGQTLPKPESIDFTPGEVLGCVSGELGLRRFLEAAGHTLIVTSDEERRDSVFEQELSDADIVISQPFWPAYLTKERIAEAPDLKLAITAGIGSDHVDLNAAIARGITVAEVTFCNSISVAEHAVMQILALVRDFLPSHDWILNGGWNIADSVERAYDLEGMNVGVLAAGRIGLAVLRRMAPFDVRLHSRQALHRLGAPRPGRPRVHQGWMSLPLAVLAATAGNLAGSLFAYAVGATHLLQRLPIAGEVLRRWDSLLERHGARAVFIARLLPPARTFVSLPAGARHIQLIPFIALTTIGCALWALVFVLTGMLAANAWTTIDSIAGRALLAIGLAKLAAAVLHKRNGR